MPLEQEGHLGILPLALQPMLHSISLPSTSCAQNLSTSLNMIANIIIPLPVLPSAHYFLLFKGKFDALAERIENPMLRLSQRQSGARAGSIWII